MTKAVLALWALLAAFTASLAYYYVYVGLFATKPGVIYALAAACALLLAVALFGRPAHKAAVLVLALFVAALELPLQVLAAFSLLPGIGMVEDFAPYARVYSHGPAAEENSINNRWGWHAPAFRLEPGSRRVALIGDSFIHAPDIYKRDHMAVRLEAILKAKRPDEQWEVMPLGISGTGPAYYAQLLRYAHERLGVHEAVIFITTANDFKNSVYAQMPSWWTPPRYLYYVLGPGGKAAPDPASAPALRRLTREFELNHGPLIYSAGRIARSHFILERLVKQLLDRRRHDAAPAAPGDALAALGIDPHIFRAPPTPEARESAAIVTATLRDCAAYAKSNGITLRLAVIPYYPDEFYAQDKAAWNPRVKGYDFARPEDLLVEFAAKEKLAVLPLGRHLRAKGLPPKDVWKLFLWKGYAHFNASGQSYVAEALYDTFYARP